MEDWQRCSVSETGAWGHLFVVKIVLKLWTQAICLILKEVDNIKKRLKVKSKFTFSRNNYGLLDSPESRGLLRTWVRFAFKIDSHLYKRMAASAHPMSHKSMTTFASSVYLTDTVQEEETAHMR